MARKFGEQSYKESDNSDLGEELADVIFVVLCIANQTKINLQESFDGKIKLKSMRIKTDIKIIPSYNQIFALRPILAHLPGCTIVPKSE